MSWSDRGRQSAADTPGPARDPGAPHTAERLRQREAPDIHSSSADYARRFAGPVGSWFLEVQARQAMEILGDPSRGTLVLDVGGGHGQLTPYLRGAGLRVVTAGTAPVCAVRVRPLLEPGECEFVATDLFTLPFPDRAFSAVLCFRILPHVQAWRRLIAELCRVSRKLVVADYPSSRSANVAADRLFGLKKRIEGNTRPYRLFHPNEIASAFESEGFRIAGTRKQFALPMAFHRAMGSAKVSRALEWGPRVAGLRKLIGSPVIVRAETRRY